MMSPVEHLVAMPPPNRRYLLFLSLMAITCQVQGVDVFVVIGSAGADRHRAQFQEDATRWKEACEATKRGIVTIDAAGETAVLERLDALLKDAAKDTADAAPLWLVLIGHGSEDGRDSHFNLPGPDLSAKQLQQLLKPIRRELVLVATSACSGAFLPLLSAPRRTIVTATKGADEMYYTRFGGFFTRGIAGLPEADLDQDQQVSVLEAFLFSSNQTAQFYEKEERISTEHALLDDNGDGAGTRAERFAGLTLVPQGNEQQPPEGRRARQLHLVLSQEEQKLCPQQRASRDALEAQVRALVSRKAEMASGDYYLRLEALLRQIAEVVSPIASR
jgi:hypothetical protein